MIGGFFLGGAYPAGLPQATAQQAWSPGFGMMSEALSGEDSHALDVTVPWTYFPDRLRRSAAETTLTALEEVA